MGELKVRGREGVNMGGVGGVRVDIWRNAETVLVHNQVHNSPVSQDVNF